MRDSRRTRKAKVQTLQGIGIKVLLPVFLALVGLLLCLFVGLKETRALAEQYITDTAGLYVERVNQDIHQINAELIQMLNNDKNVSQIPEKIQSAQSEYYELLGDIQNENRLMKIRYKEVQSFFVYAGIPDVLIGDNGTVFSESKVDGFLKELRDFSREVCQKDYGTAKWDYLYAEGNTYIIGWYSRNEKVLGCVIEMDTVFSMIHEMTQRYQVLTFMEKPDGTTIFPENFQEEGTELDSNDINENHGIYRYQLGTLGKLAVYILPDGGIMEDVLELQAILVILITFLMILCAVQVFRYYHSLMRPLQSFVQGITDLEEEQQLNENGNNNILELEVVSDRFRGLLRKIQSLKIAIYEKELNEKKAELEYMQEQIRPHFFLNCLSLIHGIADAQGEEKITYITRVLSEYIRYNYRDSDKERNLQEELEHVKKYVELQKLRYGEDAFRFEVIEDAQVGESHIPSLVLQTLVENSVVHAVNLDRMVEISVYITSEVYEDGKYLYLCVSDTGKGFSPEIMEAIEKDLPIVYNGRKHVGLQNIKRRLMLLYGERASMTIQNMGENYGAIVEIRIPQNEE
ncbi:histidine kinase [Lacrimispora saccharolytica]|nr:histidine kinase [Lacrimispora saccharolytica]